MAKDKKKEALTPEERLQAALVPDWEQPYKVPENWCWTRLGNITEIIGGGTPSSTVTEYYFEGTIPWISPADLSGYTDIYISKGAKNITELGLEKSSAKMLPTNTVCLSSRAPIGYVAIAANPLCTNQGFKSFLPALCYLPRYLYWYLKGNKELLERYASGTTFLELSASKAGLVELPLPPLPEQQRIVDRIESLFAKLDEAKQKAQDALDSFETRKAAILHKAFTGELTARWRKEHGVGMESWEERTIVDLCSMIIDCPHSTPEWSDKGKICLRTTNIKDGYLDLSDVRYVTDEVFDQRNRRAVPQAGDVLLTREGNIGDVGVIPENVEICLGQRMMLLRPYKCQSAFLIYFFRNPKILTDIKAGTMGSTAPRMNIKNLKQLKIHCPNDKEQVEIVRILDDLLAKEQQAKEAAEAVLEQIDLMKKSILARAFRGELGTNNPTEESAVELVKENI